MWAISRKGKSSLVEEFIDYLESKRIDAKAFKAGDVKLFAEWEMVFAQVHPKSFTSQKLYLINNIRRRFLLPGDKVKSGKKVGVKSPPKLPVAKVKLKVTPKPKVALTKGKQDGVLAKVVKPNIQTSKKVEGESYSVKKTLAPKTPLKTKKEDGGKVLKPKIKPLVKNEKGQVTEKGLISNKPNKTNSLRPKVVIKKKDT